MGHISVDSPHACLIVPGVLNLAKVMDTNWRLQVIDAGAWEQRNDGLCVRLTPVAYNTRLDDLEGVYGIYGYGLARWEFCPGMDTDRVGVRFSLYGAMYEIPPVPPGGAYVRNPVRILCLEAAQRDSALTPRG